MLNKEPSPERAKLGFEEAVLSSFKFLTDHGLHPVDKNATFVRYESSDVFVNVYHGRASFELGVEVGRLAEPNEKVALYDMVAFANAEKTEDFGNHVMFQVSSRKGVQEFVPKVARLIQKYGTSFLKGDPEAYRKAHEAQSRGAANYEKEVNLRDVRRRAEAAWHGKDYAQVIELYGPVRGNLTEVEAKRLAYAEQQLLPASAARAEKRTGRRRSES